MLFFFYSTGLITDDVKVQDNNNNKRSFLIRNDIKLFQRNGSGDEHGTNEVGKPKGLFHIDRRRSDTDALKHSLSDAKLARQRLLKYAHVSSTDSDHDVNIVISRKNKNNENNENNITTLSRHNSDITVPIPRTFVSDTSTINNVNIKPEVSITCDSPEK